MARQKHPNDGRIDFSLGNSRLADFIGIVDTVVGGGLSALKNAAKDKDEELGNQFGDYYFDQSTESSSTPDGDGTTAAGDGSIAQKIVDMALGFAYKEDGGTRETKLMYKWGGNTPEEGFDCSGLCVWCYKHVASMDLPRTSQAQSKKGDQVLGSSPSASDLKTKPLPGDLVFFGSPVHHVGICVGSETGDFVHAPRTGSWVKVSKLSSRGDIATIRRLLPESAYEGTTGGSNGTGIGTKPVFPDGKAMSDKDWKTLKKYADGTTVDPYLIAAIGWQETHWGKLGKGKDGYILGYAVPDSGALAGYGEVEIQIRHVAARLYGLYEVTGHMAGTKLGDLLDPKKNIKGPEDLVRFQCGVDKKNKLLSSPADVNKKNSDNWKEWFGDGIGVRGYGTTARKEWYKNVKKVYTDLCKKHRTNNTPTQQPGQTSIYRGARAD